MNTRGKLLKSLFSSILKFIVEVTKILKFQTLIENIEVKRYR